LLDAARRGDEGAYAELIEPHRGELHAHCYRMLASVHDAGDAVQEAMVRAWKGLARFENRSSVRTWLFKIATNTALDAARGRARRELPLDRSAPAVPADDLGSPLHETRWLEPYPDQLPGASDGPASPEARYEVRESLELSFVAALQHLPPQQRAVLIIRQVLGFSALETAELLDTTVPAVNSALQRARATTATLLPDRSQGRTLAALGDDRVRDLAGRYADAIERSDIDGLCAMLTEDATWSMPPDPEWYRGLPDIAAFHIESVAPECWRHRPARANGQLAVGGYMYDPGLDSYVATVLDVLTLRGDRIAAVTAFFTTAQLQQMGPEETWSIAPVEFARFGLPETLPAESG
jgi:RNA polymerase sigma-70 factor (ECF subfamily)